MIPQHLSSFIGTEILIYSEDLILLRETQFLGAKLKTLYFGIFNMGSFRIEEGIFLIITELEEENTELRIIKTDNNENVIFEKLIFIFRISIILLTKINIKKIIQLGIQG